jgi:hypothetical protein
MERLKKVEGNYKNTKKILKNTTKVVLHRCNKALTFVVQ